MAKSASWAVLLAVFAACGPASVDPLPFAPASATSTPTPTEMGPFPVGVRTVTYVDTGRRQPDGSPRTLVTEIWYPAVQSARGSPTVDYDILPVFTEAQQAAIGPLPLLHTAAIRDAEPARSHGPFPLVIFCHGMAAIRWQSTFYTVLLASHGYVVVSPDHQSGTLADAVRGEMQSVVAGFDARPSDVLFLLGRLERMKSDDALFGLLDFDRIGVTGHSFGALTSLRVAAMDSRVKAIVPQAPVDATTAWAGLPMPVQLQIPVLVEAAHADRTLPWEPNVSATLDVMPSPSWLLDVVHGGHFTFSDLCGFDLVSLLDKVQLDIPNTDLRKVLEDGCGATAPPASIAQPLIAHFAVAFFNAQLRGSTGSLSLLTQAEADRVAGASGVGEVRQLR